MRELVVSAFVTLDSVMQAPGGREEDTSGGFEYGGWFTPLWDDTIAEHMGESMGKPFDLVLGRKTYEIFAAYWPTVSAEDGIGAALNSLPKYVASRTLTEPQWQPTTVLHGDIPAEIEALKAEPGKDLVLLGSSNLAHTLIKSRLVDEYHLWLHPIVLGSGKRLFPALETASPMTLLNTQVTNSGLVMLTYSPRP